MQVRPATTGMMSSFISCLRRLACGESKYSTSNLGDPDRPHQYLVIIQMCAFCQPEIRAHEGVGTVRGCKRLVLLERHLVRVLVECQQIAKPGPVDEGRKGELRVFVGQQLCQAVLDLVVEHGAIPGCLNIRKNRLEDAESQDLLLPDDFLVLGVHVREAVSEWRQHGVPLWCIDEIQHLGSLDDVDEVTEFLAELVSQNEDVALAAMRVKVFCLLYTSDAADDLLCVDLGGRR